MNFNKEREYSKNMDEQIIKTNYVIIKRPILNLFTSQYMYIDCCDKYCLDGILIKHRIPAFFNRKSYIKNDEKFGFYIITVRKVYSKAMEEIIFPELQENLILKHQDEYKTFYNKVITAFNEYLMDIY